jgi:membrane protein
MGKAFTSLGRLIKRLFRPLAPFGRLLKEAVVGFMTHNVSRMAASIAYFGAFSLAPILVIAVTLASLVFGRAASEGLVFDRLVETFGDDIARFIQSMLAAIYNNSGGLTVATVLAILLLMWASTRIIGSVRGALNDIWGVPGHGGTGFLGFVFGKLIDLGFVIVIGVMFVAAMLANTAVSALTSYFSDLLPLPGWVLQLIGIVFSLLVTTIFLTIIFRYLPNIKVRFVYILMGAWVTAVLFSIGNYVIGRYLGRTSPGSTFGAAGSLAVILIWMYYSANIVLFGAEVTRAYARRGKLRKPPGGQCGFDESSDESGPGQRAIPAGIPPEAQDDPPETSSRPA